MKSKSLLILSLFLVLSSFNVLGIDYFKTTGDSIFVAGVDWQKQTSSDYTAYVTVDLAYDQFANPLDRYAIVEQYFWSNWWADFVNFGSVGDHVGVVDENGIVQDYIQLDFYTELPDIVSTGDNDDYECAVLNNCQDSVPSPRVGYYGLPFYIKYLEFSCDITDPSKGKIILSPSLNDQDTFSLIRYNYEGINNTNVSVETSITPLGWISNPGEIVRYSGIPVFCKNMNDTSNAQLDFILKPNPLYRDIDPNTIDSDVWSFQNLVSIFPDVNNRNELPFNINVGFNFTANTVNYSMTNDEVDAYYNNLFGDPNNNDLDCTLESSDRNTRYLKFSELTDAQKLKINTGESVCSGTETILGCSGTTNIISCVYPDDVGVITLNNRLANNILDSISLQKQQETVLQFNQLDKKMVTKKFVSESIIPFFGALIILIFYFIQIIILGVAFFGIIPLMFKEFIKGAKESFSLDDVLKPVNKGGKK